MADTEFATAADIARLGNGVLAVRVTGGKVPPGMIGMSLCRDLVQHHVPGGKAVTVPKHGKLWWVCPDEQVLCLAPTPATPEAGVELVLQLHSINGVPTGVMAVWLDRQASVVEMDAVRQLLIGHPDLQLPPCVQADELQRFARSASGILIRAVGMRCLQLRCCDLYPEVNCATTGVAVVPPKPAAFATESAKQAGSADTNSPGSPAPAKPSPAMTLAVAVQADARFEERYFIELPLMAQQLRRLPWPDDSAAFAQQRAVLRRVEHLAATSGRLPGLTSRIDPHQLDAARILLLCAESRKAAQALDHIWAELALPDNEISTQAVRIKQIDITLAALEMALARRRSPWWEAL